MNMKYALLRPSKYDEFKTSASLRTYMQLGVLGFVCFCFVLSTLL